MAETSSLLNCRRGNSTASSNLVLSAFEQPTAVAVGCFVIEVPPSLLERALITKQPEDCAAIGCSKAAAPRERTRCTKYKCRANERRVEHAPTMPNAADVQRSPCCVNLVAPAAHALPFHPYPRISRTPVLFMTFHRCTLAKMAFTYRSSAKHRKTAFFRQ